MLRALIWKEWRGLRTIWIVCAIAVCAACVVGGMRGNWLLGWLALALAGMLIGAQLFAGEKANGTADFSTRLPVSRKQAWLARMIIAHVAWGLLVVVIVAWRLSWQEYAKEYVNARVWNTFCLFLLPSAWFSLAIGTLCGALLDRPVTAVGAALALMVMIYTLVMGLLWNEWLMQDVLGVAEPYQIPDLGHVFLPMMAVCASIAFALSYFICVRRW